MPRVKHTPQPPDAAEREAGLALQVLGSLVIGLIVGGATGEPWREPGFWLAALAAGFGTFLLVFWVRQQWLVPVSHPEVSERDQARLTEAITLSRRSTYAISSNWLALWQSSTFRYYLHLDAAMSVVAHSSGLEAPLDALSTEPKHQEAFFREGWELLNRIGGGELPLRHHRVRLLIYPQWVYTKYSTEVRHLIASHSAARIPCVPLIAEELYAALDETERKQVAQLAGELGQTPIDKLPPLSRRDRWRTRRALRRRREIGWWPPVFPDMLLIDPPFATDKAGLWWYAENGSVFNWDADNPNNPQALAAFQAICRHAGNPTVWSDYAPANIGGVVVTGGPARLESEAFFAKAYYSEWLTWIKENAVTDQAARSLNLWFDEESRAMTAALDEYASANADRTDGIEVLDVGCGFGRHLVEILTKHETWRGMGIDINTPMVSEATKLSKREGVHYRASFVVTDAADLEACGNDEFDVAVCMTNTVGNLTKSKQAKLIRRLRKVLRPGGKVFISAYSQDATAGRLRSYEAVGLAVEVQGDRIVAAEGLESQAFTPTTLRALLEENGLDVIGQVTQLGSVGLCVTAERPNGRRANRHDRTAAVPAAE